MTAIERNADGTYNYHPGVTRDDVVDLYKQRSETYDDVMREQGFKGPALAAKEVLTYFPTKRDIKILDCGAGTGCVGEELYPHGFTQIDAVDPCKEMLALLEKKQIYNRIICDFLGTNKLPIEDDSYDCLTFIGVIFAGAASENCFPEMIRVVKPGGIIIITTREANIETDPHLKDHLEPEMQRLHDNRTWEWLKREIVPNYNMQRNGYLAVFRVL